MMGLQQPPPRHGASPEAAGLRKPVPPAFRASSAKAPKKTPNFKHFGDLGTRLKTSQSGDSQAWLP